MSPCPSITQDAPLRQSIRTARKRIEQHLQKTKLNLDSTMEAADASERQAQVWIPGRIVPPDVRLFVKHDYYSHRRGAANAMGCLIEKHGIGKLQQRGVVASSDGIDSQDHYLREIAVVAKAYGVTTYVVMPVSTHRTKVEELQANGIVVELRKDGSRHIEDALAEMTAFPFPSHDEAHMIHGYGTIALELEEEVRSVLETSSTLQSRRVGKLDAVIAIMGNGSALCGICMAFQRTGTRVFGAEVLCGRGDTFRKDDSPYPEKDRGGCNATQRVSGDSVGALPWSVFTSPSLLSAVLYVDQQSAQLAQSKLIQQLRINAGFDDAVPLALALYSEDFRQFLEKEKANRQELNVGVIIRSDISACRDGQRTRTSISPEDDLTRYMRVMYW